MQTPTLLTFEGSIDFNTVPASKFEYPQIGYRMMTYEENKKGKAGQ